MKYIILIASGLFLSSSIIGQSASLLNGVFECNKNSFTSKNQTFTSNTASAYFNSQAVAVVNPNLGLNAGNIKVNNTALQLFSNNIYGDITNTIDFGDQHWIVTGGSSIPAMDFITTQPLPIFKIATSGNPQAKVAKNDTLDKSDTLYVNIEDLKYADSLTVSIIDGYGAENDSLLANGGSGNNGRVFLNFQFSTNGNELQIPPSMMNSLHVGPKAVVIIKAHNYTIQNIQGQNFLFKNYYTLGEANIYIKD